MSDQETSSPFETIRHTTDDGAEYWSARELAEVLGYAKWANFVPTIKDAKKACEGSGQTASDHFLETRKMVALGSGSQRAVDDFHLSRYACYLVVQNADPSKPIVALGQTYFAVRTREAELAEEAALQGLNRDQARLYMRARMTDYNKQLAEAAKAAGVPRNGFAAFQNHGYRGLYAGETAKDIAARKGLRPGQEILDWMEFDELAANAFRASLTGQKLRNDPAIDTQAKANKTHHDIGAVVRNVIIEQGGTPPEQLPTPAQSIQQIQRQEQKRIEAGHHAKLQPPLSPRHPSTPTSNV
jgi:DNA-damage-inducible protein D